MAFKSILVCPSDEYDTRQLTHVACAIAHQSPNTRVLGAHWITRIHEFKHGEHVGGEWSNDFDRPLDKMVQAMSTKFYQVTGDMSFPCDWVSIDAEVHRNIDVLVEYARCTDLVVTAGLSQNWVPMMTQLVINSGRPVLVVPEQLVAKPEFDTVVVAWNASRESARAAFDALPFLKRAKNVEILWIEQRENPDNMVHFLIKEFAAALALHDISAVVKKIANWSGTDQQIGDLLVGRVREISADLMVAGAYGKTGEDAAELGSVSLRLVSSSPVAVLFSA